MKWKIVVFGGLAYYVTTFVVSFATGPIIHTGILDPIYSQYEQFWIPELRTDPPDMAAVMPEWITKGLISAMVIGGLYAAVRGAFKGPGWRRGLLFGAVLSLIHVTLMLGWSGVIDLPDKLWFWWGAENFLYNLPGGAMLGLVAQKLAPVD